MLVEEIIETEETELQKEEQEMPSFNHSYLCWQISEQLSQNDAIAPLPELTLNIENGIIPDISVFPKANVKPDFLHDIPKFSEMPIIAVEVISASQNIQDLLEKAKTLVENGVKAVWTVEPFTNTVFVTTSEDNKRIHNQEVESEGIKVDFRKIFAVN